jgi:asparagine synthase (glutamine-hydrolysing)
MCGIAGQLGHQSPDVARVAVRSMVAALAHRGPDWEGIAEWPGAVLGHRRLAVFDLSPAGRQPMLSADGKCGIVFNGAVYNWRDLRKELASSGAQFTSQTDTEVILVGYQRWGIDAMLVRLRGMFAFCIWDDRTKTAWLVRDRLGVKPLYFVERDGGLAFASTARALASTASGVRLSDSAVASVLEFGFIPDNLCIYEGMRKVPAGCLVEWRLPGQGRKSEAQLRRYWSQPESGSLRIGFQEAVEETERLLLQAVQRRLDADVPVAALLSGGIDSALVCWAASKLGADIQSFTVGAPGELVDETAEAAVTARQIGIRHRVLPLDSKRAPNSRILAQAYGEPFPCSSAFGMLAVSELVKPEATVMLTGDGGDDVFLGYENHIHYWHAQRISRYVPAGVASAWTRLREGSAEERGPAGSQIGRALRFVDYVAGGLGAVESAHDSQAYFTRWRLPGERLNNKAIWQAPSKWSLNSARHLLQQYLNSAIERRFTGEYMTKVDGGAMWYAVEARSPFLDQDLWEFAARLPSDIKLRHGKPKAILRELARRRIGPQVAFRKKRGFSIPAERWMVTAWRQEMTDNIKDLRLAQLGFVDRKAIEGAWTDAQAHREAPRQLWYVHALETWLRYEERSRTIS